MTERGFSLMEALVATLIAVIAVSGLAYTFGVGRGQVDRYAVARAALGAAKSQMEALVLLDPTRLDSDSLDIGYVSPATPFVADGAAAGTCSWRVDPYDSPVLPGSVDMRRLTVTVSWTWGAMRDSVQLDRLFALP